MLLINKNKNMKKIIYVLLLSLVVVGGLVFANGKIKSETPKKSTAKPLTVAEKNEALKKWEASPNGIHFKEWEASPEGQKVIASSAKISKLIKDFSTMEAVVTSVSLPPGSRLGFGVMVKINGDDYILAFGPEKYEKDSYNFSKDFEYLHRLKVNDTIGVRSHNISKAPKYSYPIIAGDYIEQDGKIIYERPINKDGC